MFYQNPKNPVKEAPTWTPERLGWLALCWFDGFGNRTIEKLQRIFGDDGQAALNVTENKLAEFGHTKKVIARFLEFRRSTNPHNLVRRLELFRISFVLSTDAVYPPLLAQMNDPPAALFLRGSMLNVPQDTIAVVGTRNPTPYGQTVTRSLCHDLVHAGFSIVSGLALGIDAAAHTATLDENGYTIAVLGSGIDDPHIYPRHHVGLAQTILERGGSLISELPPGSEAFRHHFPMRNRIIAGLCRATIVVEAAESSGSLLTANLALQYNRDVFAVPGPITSFLSRGTNRLLKQGAIPCTDINDILEALGQSAPTTDAEPISLPELTPQEQRIFDALPSPRHVDDLFRDLEMNLSSMMRLLTDLELRGIIEERPGNFYARRSTLR